MTALHGPELAVAFAAVLRSGGVEVAVGRVPVYADALAAVGVGDRDAVYWAGRATLLGRPEEDVIAKRLSGFQFPAALLRHIHPTDQHLG